MSFSARDTDPSPMKEVELECGDISALKEELLAHSFLAKEGPEVFSTLPEQSSLGQGGEEEDAITMCTLPFTTSSPSPSRSSSENQGKEDDQDDSTVRRKEPQKPRICAKKVRGTRIRTPSPSLSPDRSVGHVDPLVRAVLMIPSTPAPTFSGDLLALDHQHDTFES